MKRLTPQQQRFFQDEGYLGFGPFLEEDRVRRIGEAIDAVASGEVDYPPELIRWEPGSQGADLGRSSERKKFAYQIRYPHRHLPFFMEHASDPAVLDVVEDLLGPDLVLYNTQALLKPAFHGTSQPWHQDAAYWPIRPMKLVSCWIAIDEATLENGCMRFIPGSHKLGLAEHRSGRPLSAASGGTAAAVQEIEVEESRAVAVPARPGHGSLHHCLTHHGTPPNRTPHRRRAIICHYMPLDFRYTGPEEERPQFHVVRGRRNGEIV